jgi:hypothetical protein
MRSSGKNQCNIHFSRSAIVKRMSMASGMGISLFERMENVVPH